MILVGGIGQYPPAVAIVQHAWDGAWEWVQPQPTGPITLAIVVYESKNQPVAEVAVLMGKTANAARKLDKWRQYDKDKLPESRKEALAPYIAKHGVPCFVLLRDSTVVYDGKLSATDQDLDALIKQKGGF
jgi:hypothetical protein